MVAIHPSSEPSSRLFSPRGELLSPLPPSERDFQIFEVVAFEGASTREVAQLFGLSQTRIMQVRDRVAQWIVASVPLSLRLSPFERLGLAYEIARGRLDYLYSQATEAWRSSHREGSRFLILAARITEHSARVSSVIERAVWAAEKLGVGGRESGVGDGREGEAPAEQQAVQEAAPPVRACSDEARLSPQVVEDDLQHAAATYQNHDTCDEIEARRQAFLSALNEDTSPVQPPRVDANGMLLEEEPEREELPVLRLAAGAEGQTAGTALLARPLNRKQRRARQRELERKMRRKAR